MTRPKPATVVAWLAVVLVCAYFPVAYDRMVWETTHFELMLEGYGVPLSLPARVIISHHAGLYALLFGVPALLILLKELFVRDKRLSLIITLSLAVAVLVVADAMRALLTYALQHFKTGFA